MGLTNWLFGGGSPTGSDKKVIPLGEDVKTMQADFDPNESQTSRRKLFLYLYLGFLSLVWHDLCATYLGRIGGVVAFLVLVYIAALCWPGPIGPWNYQERMQVRSVLIMKMSTATAFIALPLWCLFVADGRWFSWLPFSFIRTLFLIYLAWIWTLDAKAGKRGVRFFPSFRRRQFWRHFAGYFPVKLTRMHKLDPEKNYIFGYHPHGIISVGAILNFGTFATGFDQLFPGVDLRLLTLSLNFKVPFLREVLLAMGGADASKESISYNLKQDKRSVMLVIGGAAEALHSGVGKNELCLENRKGFVKMALRTGASLVPVFSFGENDVYETVKLHGGWRRLQMMLQKKMGFSMPIFFGRALSGGIFRKVFKTNIGLFPFRTPIHSVVGKPVDVPKLPEAEITNEQIEKYHKLYIVELRAAHDAFHDTFEKEKLERIEELKKSNEIRQEILEKEGQEGGLFAKLSDRSQSMQITGDDFPTSDEQESKTGKHTQRRASTESILHDEETITRP